MPVKLETVRNFLPFFLLLPWAGAALAQPVVPTALTPAQAQALVGRALATELRTAQDAGHPMRYRLRKSSPRMTTTKEIVETRDGDVARLVRLNDQPLSLAAEQQEEARLNALLSDPEPATAPQAERGKGRRNRSQAVAPVAKGIPLPICRLGSRPLGEGREVHLPAQSGFPSS